MVSKVFTLTICTLACFITTAIGRSNKYKELKPVLIKSVISHPRVPYNNNNELETAQHGSQEEEQRTSRKIYQFPGPGHQGYVRGPPPPKPEQDPERGQILHRPKTGSRNGQQSQNGHNQNEMPQDAPVLLNGKGKKVKYVPTNSMGGYQGPEKPPQVYVISNNSEDEDEEGGSGGGMMNSMQTYFKSMTKRIRGAFQGLIGGITD